MSATTSQTGRRPIELRTLGSVALTGADGRPLQTILQQPKRLALLVYLIVARPGGFHRRDELLALFWPDRDEARARNALSQAVYRLRAALGDEAVPGRGVEELGVDASVVWCDAVAFDELLDAGRDAEASALYEGDLLPGFHASEIAPDLERWLDEQRTRLRARAAAASWRLAEEAERDGRSENAVQRARRAAELTPDDERGVARLMELHARRGDRASAVRVYDDFTQRLARDYELTPSPSLHALVERVRHDPPTTTHGPSPAAVVEPQSGVETRRIAAPTRATRRIVWLAGAVAVLAAGVFAWQGAVSATRAEGTARRVLDPKRVVVSPLENLTGDSTLDPIGRMAADWITQGLTATGFLYVVESHEALTASLSDTAIGPRRSRVSALALATQTGAGTVLSGAYYLQGDSIGFRVNVMDAASGEVLRAIGPVGSAAREPLRGVELLRERVIVGLASRLDPRLASWEGAGAAEPPTVEAYQLYLDGMERYTSKHYAAASEMFERAAGLAPGFSLATLWAAQSYVAVARTTGDPPAPYLRADSLLASLRPERHRLSPYEQAKLQYVAALRAADNHASYRAAREMMRAAPGSVDAVREVALNAIRTNRFDEGAELLERLDLTEGMLARFGPEYWFWLGRAHHFRRAHERELDVARRGRRDYPTHVLPQEVELRALAALGRVDEVRTLLRQLPTGSTPEVAMSLHTTAALELRAHGHDAAARAILDEVVEMSHRLSPSPASERRRAAALFTAGRFEDVLPIMQARVRADSSDLDALGRLGVILARSGRPDEARRLTAQITLLPVDSVRRNAQENERIKWRARVATALGDREQAVALLRTHFDRGLELNGVVGFHTDPVLVELRGYGPFERLLRAID